MLYRVMVSFPALNIPDEVIDFWDLKSANAAIKGWNKAGIKTKLIVL